MVRSCCVIGCSRKSHDSKCQKLNYGDRFFGFPTLKKGQGQHVADVTKRRRIAWVSAVRRKNITFANISRFMYVCSRHFHKGQPAYEMMETDPDWAPSLYLGHTEITCTNTTRSARQRKREQRKNPLQPAEVEEQHTVDDTHKAEGGGAKSDDPLSPDRVPSIFTHTPAIKKRKRESYEQHNTMKNKRVEEKKPDAVDVLLELSSEPDAELAPLEEEEQQCDNRLCKEKTERLQKECNELREENQRLRSSNVKWM